MYVSIVEKKQKSSLIFMEFGMKIQSVDYKNPFWFALPFQNGGYT